MRATRHHQGAVDTRVEKIETRSLRITVAVLLAVMLCACAGVASAQPTDIPPTWGGDVLTRPRLTGHWFGLRDAMGKKGVVLDLDILLTPQGVLTGGRDTGAEFRAAPSTR